MPTQARCGARFAISILTDEMLVVKTLKTFHCAVVSNGGRMDAWLQLHVGKRPLEGRDVPVSVVQAPPWSTVWLDYGVSGRPIPPGHRATLAWSSTPNSYTAIVGDAVLIDVTYS